MKPYNILLVGNGFDLAHGLPTEYKHFLHFCQCVNRIFTYSEKVSVIQYRSETLDVFKINSKIREILETEYEKRKPITNGGQFYFSTDLEVLSEIHNLLEKNVWYCHFLKTETYLNDNWIDFEREMSKVIQSIDFDVKAYKKGEAISDKAEAASLRFIQNYSGKLSDIYDVNMSGLLQKMENDLNRFKRAFELYLTEFVEEIRVEKKLTQISELKIDKVLSFNYTSTYKRIYANDRADVEYCYIHGNTAKKHSIDTNNMVLGIDEYLKGKKKEDELLFIAFKKYFQRIMNGNGVEYVSWINEMEDNYLYAKNLCNKKNKEGSYYRVDNVIDHSNLYIFGHSLDLTDGDIIKRMISVPGVNTGIFYYKENESDKEKLSHLIQNLIKILGQEEVITKSGNGTLRFIPQDL